MRILIIHQYFLGKEDGGGSRFNQLSKFWAQSGHKITVIAGMVNYSTGKKAPSYKGKFFARELIEDNITVIRTHVSEKYNTSFLGRLWGYFSFTFSSTLAAMIYAGKQDVVLVTSPPLFVGITGYIASALKRIPLVFEIRDLWPESAIETGVLTNKLLIKMSYWFEALIYRKAKMINTLTPAFKDCLINEKGLSEEKVIMIPNGADLDIVYYGEKDNWVRTQYGIGNKFVVLYMGAIGVANHLITLVEAAKQIREIKDIVFMLIGDGMQKTELIEKAKEYGLDNIIFVGNQPKYKIRDFCNAADVGVAVLKKTDVFKTVYPNKVFDYMACKKPIILGIDGIARKLVEEADCGIYIEPENVDRFTKVLRELYSNKDKCLCYGENGYRYVIDKFDRKKLAKDYEEQLIKLIVKG